VGCGEIENCREVKHMRSILTIFGLIILIAGTAAAQTAPSIFSYNYGQGSGEAKSAASYLQNSITKGLLDQFPCVDQTDIDAVKALLDLERQRELLGNPDDQVLSNIGASLGADDIIVVRATTIGNGQTYLSVKVQNTRTATTVASRDSAPASGDALVDAMESVSKQILQDLAGILKGKCTPHWSGTVTFNFKLEIKDDKDEKSPGGDTTATHTLWLTENVIEAMLKSKGGDDPNETKAVVVHRFTHRDESIVADTRSVPCWPPNGAAYNKKITNKQSTIVNEQGDANTAQTVWVSVDRSDGSYTITVPYPAVKTTSHREYTETGVGCFEAKPLSAISNGEASPEAATYAVDGTEEIKGVLDPKNPDILAGTRTTGDRASGIRTVTWNLRLVKPRSSK
jgi:hypothetical protein